jgi:hypothetical protein
MTVLVRSRAELFNGWLQGKDLSERIFAYYSDNGGGIVILGRGLDTGSEADSTLYERGWS